MTLPTLHQRFIVPDLPTTDELIPYLRQIDANKWYTNFGPLSQSFEQRFAAAMARAHGVDPAGILPVCVASGYQALTVGLRLSGVGPGDRVLVPSVTFPACPLSVSHLGATPVLADVSPDSWTLTPEIARAAVQKGQFKAVMPVCVYGFPLPADAWDAFAKETGVKVVIDAAAAVESQRYLKHGIVAHSLHALKPFGIGEGGLVVTAQAEQEARIRQNINFGMENRITYQSGENAKMSEYHAAVALAQLDRWADIKARRGAIRDSYLRKLEGIVQVHPSHKETITSSLMVKIKSGSAAALCARLNEREVAAHRTYLPPLYTHPFFAGLECVNGNGESVPADRRGIDMAGAAEMEKSVLGLPFHPFLTDEEIDQIIGVLCDTLKQPMKG